MSAKPEDMKPAILSVAKNLHDYGENDVEKLKEFESNLTDLVGAIGIGIEVANAHDEGPACSQELGHGVSYLIQIIQASQNIRHQLGQVN